MKLILFTQLYCWRSVFVGRCVSYRLIQSFRRLDEGSAIIFKVKKLS